MPTPALLMASGGIGAFGSVMQGQQERNASNIEATQLEQQGQVAATEAGSRIVAQDADAIKTMGAVKAGAAAGGVAAGSGSPRAVNPYHARQAILNHHFAKY